MSVHLEPISPEQWEELKQVAGSVHQLTIMRGGLNPGQIEEIAPLLTTLERLELGFPVTDEHVAAIVRIPTLKIVNLSSGEFTDAAFARFTELPALELLRMHSPHVTDEGLKSLPQLAALKFLHLIDVPVTDASLGVIAGMTKLESFYLDGGGCTEEGLSQLVQKRPDLHFHWNDLHLPTDPADHPPE